MIDRTINLITLFVLLIAVVVLGFNLFDSWNNSEPWEKAWVPIGESEQEYSSEEITRAIKNATSAGEYSDSYRLREILEGSYRETGEVFIRLNWQELINILLYTLGSLVLLIIPVSLNYVRHGKFSAWNQRA